MFYLLFQLFSHTSIYADGDTLQTPSIPLKVLTSLSPNLNLRAEHDDTPDTVSSSATYVDTVVTHVGSSTDEDSKVDSNQGHTLRRRRTQDAENGMMDIVIPVPPSTIDPESGGSVGSPQDHSSPQLSLPVVISLLAIVIAVR